jgi:hypothetical protein
MVQDILALIVSFVNRILTQQSSITGEAMSQLSKDTIDKIAVSALKIVTAILLLGIGLSTIMLDLLMNSYAHNGELGISQVSAIGGILVIIPFIIFAFTMKKSKSSRPTPRSAEDSPASAGQLQLGILSEAISAYIMDVVEERKVKRAQTPVE